MRKAESGDTITRRIVYTGIHTIAHLTRSYPPTECSVSVYIQQYIAVVVRSGQVFF